jgi:putative endonuclease
MSKTAYVYLLSSQRNGTLYTGVTNDLQRRMYEHKNHLVAGFTDKYNVTRLVWFVQGEDIKAAIELEKKIKNRGRQWKINLIEKTNSNWDDLSEEWTSSGPRAEPSSSSFCADPSSSSFCADPSSSSFCAERSEVAESTDEKTGSCDFAQDDGGEA